MNKKFIVRATFNVTRRRRTVTFTAKSEAEVIQLLKHAGYSEPFEITEEMPEPATDAQVQYARALQINIPLNPTKDDLSALISRKVDNDGEPNPELVEFANQKGLFFSKNIGKKALYNLIFNSLSKEDRAAFFVFSVYRWLSDDRHGNLESHKYYDVFYDFAREQSSNDSFIKSLDKYVGADLRFFGTMRFADGGETQGGSTNTIAYKACADFIQSKFGTAKTRTTTIGEPVKTNPLGKSGCTGLVVGLLALVSLVFLALF